MIADLERRQFLRHLMLSALMAAGAPLGTRRAMANPSGLIQRAIPCSGERIPVIGMGTWLTFDDDSEASKQNLSMVLQTFFARGGRLIDTSPMYGVAERLLGELLPRLSNSHSLFSATKVWTLGQEHGITQMQQSLSYLGLDRIDLMQVHNLLDWKLHLKSLRSWKEEGIIRYIGVTTSHGRRHDELEKILKSEPIDFVQFTLNLNNRETEKRLLPLAAERGIATIINRPFEGGNLFRYVKGHELPGWAEQLDIQHWSQFFLKYIISNPNVTCTIPATSKVEHMKENMAAAYGSLPDAQYRQRMRQVFDSLL
ncbi:MAG: aldo/keto reductase [Gammaproteobacteria bacterium]|nr:aldo/keto reductase [Gammaproteobacteria bacterium]